MPSAFQLGGPAAASRPRAEDPAFQPSAWSDEQNFGPCKSPPEAVGAPPWDWAEVLPPRAYTHGEEPSKCPGDSRGAHSQQPGVTGDAAASNGQKPRTATRKQEGPLAPRPDNTTAHHRALGFSSSRGPEGHGGIQQPLGQSRPQAATSKAPGLAHRAVIPSPCSLHTQGGMGISNENLLGGSGLAPTSQLDRKG